MAINFSQQQKNNNRKVLCSMLFCSEAKKHTFLDMCGGEEYGVRQKKRRNFPEQVCEFDRKKSIK
jgi:hypothetical protein